MNKLICVRCEFLERRQKNRTVLMVKNSIGEEIPLCSTCILEVKEEEEFFNKEAEEEDES